MAWQKGPMTPADKLLGTKIKTWRVRQGMSQPQLGKKINETQQQVERFENGARVPIPKLERIAEALGCPIQKRIIRRISFARKLEEETNTQQEELFELYEEAFAEDFVEDDEQD